MVSFKFILMKTNNDMKMWLYVAVLLIVTILFVLQLLNSF